MSRPLFAAGAPPRRSAAGERVTASPGRWIAESGGTDGSSPKDRGGIREDAETLAAPVFCAGPLRRRSIHAAEHAGTYQAKLDSITSNNVLPDPDITYYRDFCSCSSENQDAYVDPRLDNLVIQARETFSQIQRKKLYEQAAQVVAQDLPWVPLFSAPNDSYVNKVVHGFPDTVTTTNDFSQVWLS